MGKFKSSERTFLNFRKSSPVANPDKGSHYLKKSPSPTGIKSPPGCCLEPNNETSLSPCDEIINGRPLISPSPQLPRKDNEVDGNPELSYSENEDGPRLGKLFFTIKYSFERPRWWSQSTSAPTSPPRTPPTTPATRMSSCSCCQRSSTR